jgi:hypothetical protein
MLPTEITIFLWVLSVMVAILITWGFSSRFYRKSSKDLRMAANELKDEAKKQRQMSDWILRLLEGEGNWTIQRDDKGQVVGLGLTVGCKTAKVFVKTNPAGITRT